MPFSGWPLGFYSQELWTSPEAQRQALEPDLRPFCICPPLSPDRRQLLLAFDRCQLPAAEWNHRAHLEVAAAIYQLCGEFGWQAMCLGIQRLNQAHGVPQTPTRGFHFSLTRLYYQWVGQALQSPDWEKAVQQLSRPERVLQYYRRETINSWEARCGWVEPDL